MGGTSSDVALVEGTHLTNLACAVGAAMAVGFDLAHLAAGVAAWFGRRARKVQDRKYAGLRVLRLTPTSSSSSSSSTAFPSADRER